ncbi:outer membrane efflux protein [gamma proteobacterium NOR5-3]|nr:outer membrane efflux protein [gamma proteobacterium NOR5-3]
MTLKSWLVLGRGSFTRKLPHNLARQPVSVLWSVMTIVLTLLVSGCNVAPTPISDEALRAAIETDKANIAAIAAPVSGPLSLSEAIARALKYNLNHRTRLLEESLASAQFDLSKMDMLPQVMAGVGYSGRDRENIRRAVDSVTGLPSLSNPFITSEPEHVTADLGLTWNLLDFGVSYYGAKQNADRLLVAGERRRQAMHELIQRTRSAFWRAVAADKLDAAVRDNLDEAERALAKSRSMLKQRIRQPSSALRYQRNLLENLRLLESVQRELSASRVELASLIGAEPGQVLSLIEPDRNNASLLELDVLTMEEVALANNASLREEHYNVRITALQTRKSLVQMLPGVSLDYGSYYDDDDFLIYESWRQGGLRVTYNLLNLLAIPKQQRAAKAAERVAETRRMALQVAVLTQVHLGRNYYRSVLRQFERAEQIADIDMQLMELSSNESQSGTGSELDRVAANAVSILSEVRRYQAIARVEEAASQLQATLGLEPELASLDQLSMPALTDIMRRELARDFSSVRAPGI